ncbi:aminopeptidase [Candidatus Woesearchaeota archaeon]|nr:aminopeptidase [Candidatus Woesearchaeota archaeon]
MEDSRVRKLAKLVVEYCVSVKPNDDVIIFGSSEAEEFIEELYRQIILKGANPLVRMHLKDVDYFFFKHANEKQLKHFPKHWFDALKKADAHITVETEFNTRDLSSCDPKKIKIRAATLEPIEDMILKKRYTLVSYPCPAYAQEADMSLDEWKDFVFSSCLVDWKKLEKKYSNLAKHFTNGEKVHLLGDGVDLKFSIKNKNAVYDDGKENMPGGEVYMAPVRESMNGWIKFDYPSIYDGREIRNISLEFKKGKVIKFSASKNQNMLKAALESDKNASYVGEFGIGVNPYITRFTNNLLFDEKISGTIHLALGYAYRENGGGNDSIVHWDIVKDMKKASIILDGKIVQENGKWKI